MRLLFSFVLPLCALCFASGCVQVDYFGQSFDPTPETSPVEYYTARDDIPAGRYRIIGRGTIATELRVDKYDIREALIDTARKHGADAVALVAMNKVQVGVYPPDTDFDGNPTHPSFAGGINPSSPDRAADAFGKPEELKGGQHTRTETHVRALFLKDKAALERVFARRGKNLDELVKQPEPKEARSLNSSEPQPDETPAADVGISRNPKATK